jgi:hypothetical protein
MILHKSRGWIIEQLLTIGSTAAGVCASQSPYQSTAELFDVMKAAHRNEITEKELNDDMKRGILTEPLHRQLLEDEIGKKVHDHDQNKFIYNAKYPWAHALPDGWVVDNGLEEIPVQLKCPRIRSWHEIRLKGIHGHWLLGSQHTLAVTNKPYEIFSVLNVETMRVIQFPVERDEKLIDQLMKIEERFFEDFMANVRPIMKEKPSIEMPPLTGELISIDTDEAMRAASAYLSAKEYVEESELLLDTAKEKLIELMGQARVVDFPGIRCYRSQQNGRVSLDTKAMQKDGIAIDKYQKRGEAFETFRAFPRTT